MKSEEKQKLEWEISVILRPMTWDNAIKYAKSLGDGWRLPTRGELIDAYDTEVEGFRSGYYWGSDVYVKNPNCAWYVSFSYGYANLSNKADKGYVRCVRKIK